MANYSVSTYTTGRKNNPDLVLTALETKIETLPDGRDLRYKKVLRRGFNQFEGLLIYDASE